MKIYLAGPLFSEAERAWMSALKGRILLIGAKLGSDVEVLWPWEFISEAEVIDLGKKAGVEVFRRCKAHLESADILVAMLDGSQVDDGTAWEIGYYFALKKGRIIGIRTDFRRAGETEGAKVNAMIEFSADTIVNTKRELLDEIKAHLKGRAH